MFEGMDMGTLWRMKSEPNGDLYRVFSHTFSTETDLTVTFDRDGAKVEYTVAWARENMQPVI